MVGGWAESVGVRVRAAGLRHEAGAAQHASVALSTLSERSAPSDTLRNARPSPQATRRCGCHRAPLDQALTHPQIVRAAAHVRGCWCRLLEWLPDMCSHTATVQAHPLRRVLGHHIRYGSWKRVRPRARVATAAAACGSRSPAAAFAAAVRARRRRHESAPHGWCCWARITDPLHAERTHCSIACAAERVRATRSAPPPLPTVSGTALAGWCGEGWWECRWRVWACMGELAGCGIWLVPLSTHHRRSPR